MPWFMIAQLGARALLAWKADPQNPQSYHYGTAACTCTSGPVNHVTTYPKWAGSDTGDCNSQAWQVLCSTFKFDFSTTDVDASKAAWGGVNTADNYLMTMYFEPDVAYGIPGVRQHMRQHFVWPEYELKTFHLPMDAPFAQPAPETQPKTEVIPAPYRWRPQVPTVETGPKPGEGYDPRRFRPPPTPPGPPPPGGRKPRKRKKMYVPRAIANAAGRSLDVVDILDCLFNALPERHQGYPHQRENPAFQLQAIHDFWDEISNEEVATCIGQHALEEIGGRLGGRGMLSPPEAPWVSIESGDLDMEHRR